MRRQWRFVSAGSDFGIRINCRRSSRNTTAYVYIYGAEIEVDYTMQEPKLYVKQNGSWVLQTDPTTVFQSGVNYKHG